MSEQDGGPAFPVPMIPIDRNGGHTEVQYQGLSLRDWMAATLSHDSLPTFTSVKAACEWSGREMPKDDLEMFAFSLELEARMRYAQADAMLAERERKPA